MKYSTYWGLGGVTVSVNAIVPKVRKLKPGRGDGLLRAMNIRSTHSFGGEVKPSAPCRKVLLHVKNYFEVRANMLRRLNSSSASPSSP
jgi:hypothetical protein